MGTSYTPEDYTNWALMYQQGSTLDQISKQTGASIPTIITHLKALGVTVNEDFEPQKPRLSEPQGEPGGTRNVSIVMAFNEEGKMLFGKRYRSGKWAVPGGHFKKGEFPVQAALRELFEETGLRPIDGSMRQVYMRPGLWVFKAKVRGKPTNLYDPDKEFETFNWYDVSHGIPNNLLRELDPPADGSEDAVKKLIPSGSQSMNKSEPKIEETKLDHFDRFYMDENPKVRMMALKFNGLTSDHLSRCMSDPDLGVVRAALGHPLCTADHLTEFLKRPDLDMFVDEILSLRDHKLFNSEHSRLVAEQINTLSNIQVKRILTRVLADVRVPNDIVMRLLTRIVE